MDDDMRPDPLHGRSQCGGVEDVDNDRFNTRSAQGVGLRGGTRRAAHLVPGPYEQSAQPLSDGPGGACEEDHHESDSFERGPGRLFAGTATIAVISLNAACDSPHYTTPG